MRRGVGHGARGLALALVACQGANGRAPPVEPPARPVAVGSGPVVAPPTVEPAPPGVEPAKDAKDTEQREVLARIHERVEGFATPQADTAWAVVKTLTVNGEHWVAISCDCDAPGCPLRLVRFDAAGSPIRSPARRDEPMPGEALPGSDTATAWDPSAFETLEAAELGGVPVIRVGYTSAGQPECGVGHERRTHLAHVRVSDGALLWHGVVATSTAETVESCVARLGERDVDGDGRSDVVLAATCKRAVCEDPAVLADPAEVRTYGCAGHRPREREIRYLQGADGVHVLRQGDRPLGRRVAAKRCHE